MKPLRGPALTEAVRDHVKQYILDHNLKAGDPLPSELDLARELGVGRSSVREAVKALQSLGIVEVRHGQGLYVRAYNMDSIFENFSFGMRFDQRTLMEWLEIRTWLESAVIRDSIDTITPEALRDLGEILDEWEVRLKEDRPHVDLDERFHRVLYRGLNNQTLMKFLGVFWIVYQSLEVLSHMSPSPEAKARTLEEHRLMLAAIQRGDKREAIRCLQDGFATLRQRLEQSSSEPV